jgi:hypothetical protein
MELRKFVLQDKTEEDRKREHYHQNYKNSGLETTLITSQSTLKAV